MKAKRRQQQEECKRKKEEEQQQQVDRYMTEYDKDGSGVLDKEEFTTLLKAVFASYADAINGDVIDKLIKSCESQGGITKENISRVTRKYAAYLKEMAAAATARESIFNRFDTDGDGTISKQEMLPILKLCAKMIKGVPENEVRNARCAAAPRCCPCAQQSPPPSPIEPLRGKGYPWGWESPGRKRAFMPRPHLAPLTRRILPLFERWTWETWMQSFRPRIRITQDRSIPRSSRSPSRRGRNPWQTWTGLRLKSWRKRRMPRQLLQNPLHALFCEMHGTRREWLRGEREPSKNLLETMSRNRLVALTLPFGRGITHTRKNTRRASLTDARPHPTRPRARHTRHVMHTASDIPDTMGSMLCSLIAPYRRCILHSNITTFRRFLTISKIIITLTSV